MIVGYVINNTGKHKHIFKRGCHPGIKVKLKDLYNTYKLKYEGDFDLDFIEWLDTNKVPSGFDIVVEKYTEEKKERVKNAQENFSPTAAEAVQDINLSSRQISELKIKDDPKHQIKEVDSVHKLRRALTLCKGKPGKATLIKYIKGRISELS